MRGATLGAQSAASGADFLELLAGGEIAVNNSVDVGGVDGSEGDEADGRGRSVAGGVARSGGEGAGVDSDVVVEGGGGGGVVVNHPQHATRRGVVAAVDGEAAVTAKVEGVVGNGEGDVKVFEDDGVADGQGAIVHGDGGLSAGVDRTVAGVVKPSATRLNIETKVKNVVKFEWVGGSSRNGRRRKSRRGKTERKKTSNKLF